jgi:hypothetical protein
MSLRDWYNGQGSNESIAKRAMKILHTTKFTSQTPGGADGYIYTFDQALQDLEETKHVYDPTVKKIMFLENIHEDSYKIVVEMLKLDDKRTYKDCIIEIRRRSVDVEKDRKIPSKRFFRRANNTQGAQARAAPGRGNGNRAQQPNQARTDNFMPRDVWNNMSREQQQAVLIRRQEGGARPTPGGNREPGRLPRQYANANPAGIDENDQGMAL